MQGLTCLPHKSPSCPATPFHCGCAAGRCLVYFAGCLVCSPPSCRPCLEQQGGAGGVGGACTAACPPAPCPSLNTVLVLLMSCLACRTMHCRLSPHSTLPSPFAKATLLPYCPAALPNCCPAGLLPCHAWWRGCGRVLHCSLPTCTLPAQRPGPNWARHLTLPSAWCTAYPDSPGPAWLLRHLLRYLTAAALPCSCNNLDLSRTVIQQPQQPGLTLDNLFHVAKLPS
ncbi:hypothetical protein V8C86DRAFT_623532 [Haematococcus lacustris]